MVSLILTIICLSLAGLRLLAEMVIFLVGCVVGQEKISNIYKWFIASFIEKEVLIPLIAALVLFIGTSFIPYQLQQKDCYLIESYNKNIVLFEDYIDEYSEAARIEIEETAEMLIEKVRSATPTQLQYWASQEFEIQNQLTEKIKFFKDNIMEQEIAINEAESRISMRLKNKWYYGVE